MKTFYPSILALSICLSISSCRPTGEQTGRHNDDIYHSKKNTKQLPEKPKERKPLEGLPPNLPPTDEETRPDY
jgi:hypothetical protein